MSEPHPKSIKSPHVEGGTRHYSGRGPNVDRSKLERATLPTDPCFRCGARGWCEHRAPGSV